MTGITQRPGGFSYQRMTNVSPATWQVFSPAGRVAALTYSAGDAERVADALGYQQQPAAPSASVGVKTLSEFMAEQEALHPGIHDKVQAATDELRASLAQQPAAVEVDDDGRDAPAQATQAVPQGWPRAAKGQRDLGWTLEYRFLERVTDLAASRTEYSTSMEATEQVLIAALEVLAAQQQGGA